MSVNLHIEPGNDADYDIVWLFSQREYNEALCPLVRRLHLELLGQLTPLEVTEGDERFNLLQAEVNTLTEWLSEHQNENPWHQTLLQDMNKITKAFKDYQGTGAEFSFG